MSSMRAIMRAPAPGYGDFYPAAHIDMALAGAQHAAYAEFLRSAGVSVDALPGEPDLPDCVFVEDPAVICGDRALITRALDHRAGEAALMADVLSKDHALTWLPPGAVLEGGDVLRVDGHVFVGLSRRTNQLGARALADFLRPTGWQVREIAVDRCLHLKTGVTRVGDNTLVISEDLIDPAPFAALGLDLIRVASPAMANCLRIGSMLAAPAHAEAVDDLARIAAFADRRGLGLSVLDISEFEKGEGGLTCLSLTGIDR